MESVGLIGFGNMGSAMGERLLKAGYPLIVFDASEEAMQRAVKAGAQRAEAPDEVGRAAAVVLSSLTDPPAVEAIALGRPRGLVEGLRPDSVYVDLSTSSPVLIRQIGAVFKKQGAHVVDAPISGGRAEMLEGRQEIMASGDSVIVDRVRPILATFADQILYIGELGMGTVCKLVHNMCIRSVSQALNEGLMLGEKAGVDPEVLREALRLGLLGRNFLASPESSAKRVHTFTLALARKDMELALELGREINVPMPLANLVLQDLIHAMNRGWGAKTGSVVTGLLREAAGLASAEQVETRANNQVSG